MSLSQKISHQIEKHKGIVAPETQQRRNTKDQKKGREILNLLKVIEKIVG